MAATHARVHSYLMRLDLEDAIQRQVHAGQYEPEQTRWLSRALAKGHRFVDVGANCGYYAALASHLVGETGRVFAFEPSPAVADLIAEMVDVNRITNIELVRAAVGADNGDIEIYVPTEASPVHSPSVFYSDASFAAVRVPMVALDKYPPLADGTAIDFVKVDVEGFEPNVIEGMKQLCKDGLVRNLVCEFNSGWLRRNSGYTPERLFNVIQDMGFTVHRKTKKVVGIESDGETPYELQDIWFSWGPTRRWFGVSLWERLRGR